MGDKERVKEIPRQRRYIGRPSLGKIFGGQKGKEKRNMGIHAAHPSQSVVRDFFGVRHGLVGGNILVSFTKQKYDRD